MKKVNQQPIRHISVDVVKTRNSFFRIPARKLAHANPKEPKAVNTPIEPPHASAAREPGIMPTPIPASPRKKNSDGMFRIKLWPKKTAPEITNPKITIFFLPNVSPRRPKIADEKNTAALYNAATNDIIKRLSVYCLAISGMKIKLNVQDDR